MSRNASSWKTINLTAGIRYWAEAPENGHSGLGFRLDLTFFSK